MNQCKDCAYYSFEEETCARRESKNFMSDVKPTDACDKYVIYRNDDSVCATCKYGEENDLGDLICVNDASEYVADFVYDDTYCDEWESKDE